MTVWTISAYGVNPVSAVLEPPTEEPITLDQAKLRAGLDWPAGDPRDAQMQGFIAAARRKVETDGDLALLKQTRVIQYDEVPAVLQLPVRPLQTVNVVLDYADGTTEILDPATYEIDHVGGRLAFSEVPYESDLRVLSPWTITVVAGWNIPAEVPAELIHVVGLLTAHYATVGRDLALLDLAQEVPYGYADLMVAWRPVVLP